MALAAWLRVPFEPLDMPRAPIARCRMGRSSTRRGSDCFRCIIDGRPVWIIAPRYARCAPRRRARTIAPGACRSHPADIAAEDAQVRAHRVRTQALGERAAETLRATRPLLSAGARGVPRGLAWIGVIAALTGAAMLVPKVLAAAVSIALALVFLSWTGLRLIGAATAWRQMAAPAHPAAAIARLQHHRRALRRGLRSRGARRRAAPARLPAGETPDHPRAGAG